MYKPRQPSKKKRVIPWLILIAIILGGLLVRATYLFEISDQPSFDHLRRDPAFHDFWARGLFGGQCDAPDGCDAEIINNNPYLRPPAYPWFLGLVYATCDSDYMAPRIVQMVLGLFSVILAFFLARALFGNTCGLITTAFMSGYWGFIYYEMELLASSLLVLLGLGLINVLRLWLDKPTYGRAIPAGLLIAVFALARPNILGFLPVLLAWAWWIGRRGKTKQAFRTALAGFFLVALVGIAPATIRNYLVSGEFVLISCNGGINLYIGNNEYSDGYSTDIPGSEELLGHYGWSWFEYPQYVRLLSEKLPKGLTVAQSSTYFGKLAGQFIRDHPGKFFRLIGRRALLFWGPAEISNNKAVHFDHIYSPTLVLLGGFSLPFSLALAGIGLILTDRKSQKNISSGPNGRKQLELIVLILLFVLTYFASFLPFLVSERFRVPIVPFLIIFASYTPYRLVQFIVGGDLGAPSGRPYSQRRKLTFFLMWLAICLALYGLARVPIAAYTYEKDRFQWHYDRGQAAKSADQTGRFISEYQQLLKLKPRWYQGHRSLGEALLSFGHVTEAISHYTYALDLQPENPRAHFNLALALASNGQFELARAHYEKALVLEPDFPEAHNNLGNLFVREKNFDQAIIHYKEALRLRPDFPDARTNLDRAGQKRQRLSTQ